MMITEQELLDFMRETAYKPMTGQELEQSFGHRRRGGVQAVSELLIRWNRKAKFTATATTATACRSG